MAEDDAPTPIAGDEKPFFAIDAEDLAEAQSSDSAATAPPPQPMMIGALGDTGGQSAHRWAGLGRANIPTDRRYHGLFGSTNVRHPAH